MSKQTQKKKKTTTNVKATFLFAALIAAFIIAMGMINFTGIAYAAESTLPDNFTSTQTIPSPNPYSKVINGVNVGFTKDITTTIGGKTYQLYCLEYSKIFPTTGLNYTKNYNSSTEQPTKACQYRESESASPTNKPCIDAGISYILTHGYDQNPTFLTKYNDADKKYVTQMAIWYYQCLRDGKMTTDGSGDYLSQEWVNAIKDDPSGYGKDIREFAEDALEACNPTDGVCHPKEEKIWIDDEEPIKYVVNNKYLETVYIAPNYEGKLKSYKVTIPDPEGTPNYNPKVIGEDGKEISPGTSIPANKKFKIRVDIDKVRGTNSIQIKNIDVTGIFEIDNGYSYYTDGDYQTILYADYETTSKSDSFPLELSIKTGPVKISKQDITNSAEVPGATLVIKDCYGTTVASWVSGKEPHYIEALPYYDECKGKYTLTETIAPAGYALSTNKVEFSVKPSGEVTSVVMTNTPTTKSPNTGSNIPWFVYLIGVLAIGAGIVVVATNTYEQKQKA